MINFPLAIAYLKYIDACEEEDENPTLSNMATVSWLWDEYHSHREDRVLAGYYPPGLA